MPEHHFDARPSGNVDGDTVLIELQEFDAARHSIAPAAESDAASLGQIDREQLARDIAAIENATAALRQGEPGLETWTGAPPPAAQQQPRPLWLLIGVLWLSTALVTAGAVVAIATFVG